MILRLVSGSETPASSPRKQVARLHVDQGDVVVVAEQGHHLLGLVVAQQAGVDEDAGQLIANGLMDEDSGDGGVHPAGQAADHPALTHLGADLGDHLLTERGHGPVAGQACDLVGEVAQHLGAAGVWATSGWNWTP